MTSAAAFLARNANESDKQQIQEYMMQAIFKDDPLFSGVGKLSPDDPFHTDLNNLISEIIEQPSNSMAIFDDEKLIALSLNEIKERGKEMKYARFQVQSEKFQHICNFMEMVENEAKLFEKYPDCKKMLYIKMVAIDASYRGQGVAQSVLPETRKLAKFLNCEVIGSSATNFYNGAAMKSLGFELIYSYNINEYKVNNRPYFSVVPPHQTAFVYCLKL